MVVGLGWIGAFGAVAALIASSYGVDPVNPRASSDLVCAGTQPKVCVWKEHQALLGESVRAASRLKASLSGMGIQTPDSATELSGSPWTFGVLQESSPDAIQASIDSSLIPSEPPPCAASKGWPAVAAQQLLTAWVDAVAGMNSTSLTNAYGAQTSAVVRAVRLEPLANQKRWYMANRSALSGCDKKPVLK